MLYKAGQNFLRAEDHFFINCQISSRDHFSLLQDLPNISMVDTCSNSIKRDVVTFASMRCQMAVIRVRVSNCSFTSKGFGKKSPPHLEVYKEMCEARRGECSLVVAADGMGRCRRVLLDNHRHLRQTRGYQRYLIRAKKILTP